MTENFTPEFCNAAKKSEVKAKAEKIIAKAKLNAEKNCELGMKSPVLFFSSHSSEEQSTIKQYSELQLEEVLAIEKATERAESIASGERASGFYPMATIRGISHLLGRSPSNVAEKISPYFLMQELLQRLCLRWYEGKFYLYNGGIYQQVPDIKALVLGALEDELSQGSTNQLLRNVVDLLSSYPAIRAVTAQLPYTEIPFVNGIFNIDTGTLRGVTPHDFFINFINVPYPQGAALTPEFDRFLQTISNDNPQVVEAIWEMLGYLLTSDMAGKSFFVLQGVGDSGKSVLGNLIASFFNDEAVAYLDIFRLGDRFSPSILQGKHLNICMDLPDGRIRKEAAGSIKQITGGDTIAIESKFKSAKSLCPTCKLLFGTNFPLRIEHDQAFEARCVAIPFTVSIPKDKQDKALLEKLKKERPAIAAKALQAYKRLRSRNYDFIGLRVNGVFTGWVPLLNQLENFLNTCCIFDPGLHTPTSTLFACFNDYCQSNNLSGINDLTQFSRQLNQLCRGRITPRKRRGPGGNLNGYDGIGLHAVEGMVNLS